MSERIIIGETEQAGHPISAPVIEYDKSLDYCPTGIIRWRHTGTSFVLEQWFKNVGCGVPPGHWREVPCVIEKDPKQ